MADCAGRISVLVSANFLPPLRPRATAAAGPANLVDARYDRKHARFARVTDALPNHRLPQRNTENARQNHDAAAVEAKIAQKWHEADAFRAGANAKPGAETFTIDPPAERNRFVFTWGMR